MPPTFNAERTAVLAMASIDDFPALFSDENLSISMLHTSDLSHDAVPNRKNLVDGP